MLLNASKKVVRWLSLAFLVLTAWLLIGVSGIAEAESPSHSSSQIQDTIAFETSDLTQSTVDVSPDGRTLLFDHLGHLYTVPIAGGRPTQLTTGLAWHMMPRYSPDGRRIAFVSDQSGKFELWTAARGLKNPTEYRGIFSEKRMDRPAWHPTGEILSAVYVPGNIDLTAWSSPISRRTILSTNDLRLIRLDLASGAWARDGQSIYVGGSAPNKVRIDGLRSFQLIDSTKKGDSYFLPRVSRNGRVVTYFLKRSTGAASGGLENTCVLVAIDVTSRTVSEFGESARECLTQGRGSFDIPGYALLSDGSAVVMNQHGRIVRLDLNTGAKTVIPIKIPVNRQVSRAPHYQRLGAVPSPDVQARVIRWPTLTPNASMLVFSALSRIYVADIKTGETRWLSGERELFAHSPAISPDGTKVAYCTWSDEKLGHVMIMPIAGGEAVQVTKLPGRYVNPAWSSDGSKIAFVADENPSTLLGLHPSSGEEGLYNTGKEIRLRIANLLSGEIVESSAKATPLHRVNRRFYPVPVFSPDGSSLTFATQTTNANPRYRALVSANTSGDGSRHIAQLPVADEIVVSPDGRRVAAVARGRLYLYSLPEGGGGSALDVKKFTREHAVEGVNDPVHVSWHGTDTLVWAEGADIYRYELSTQRQQKVMTAQVRLPRRIPTGCLAFVNARVLTMVGREAKENTTLVVCGDRISTIDPASQALLPGVARVVDASGATIIPGLVDAHSHIGTARREVWSSQDLQLVSHLAHGVTTLWDAQSKLLDALGMSEMVEIGDAIGPRIYGAGPGIFGPDLEATGASHLQPDIESRSDALDLVRTRALYGAGPIKIYSESDRSRRQLFASAARELGVGATSHPHFFENGVTNLVDGISVEHSLTIGRNFELYDDVLKFMAVAGISYTIDSIGAGKYAVDVNDPKLGRLMSKPMLERFGTRKDNVYIPAVNVRNARSLARLGELGGAPSIGSHGSYIPGLSNHHDLWALVEDGGMPPYEALRAATLNGAEKIGMGEQIGSLEPGKLADLVVLNRNPLEDIRGSADIRYVMKGGLLYDGANMTLLWPEYQPLAPWRWQSDEERKRLTPVPAPRLIEAIH